MRKESGLLAAVVYDIDFPINELMLKVANALRAEGVRLQGTLQENTGSARCSTMSLIALATGERIGISQDLGPSAKGCRLDARGLSEMAATLDTTIKAEFDLLILNKFGRAEAEGNGLRSTFAYALGIGKPVLSAVRPPYLEAWSRFHGGLATDLTPHFDAVIAWCRRAVAQPQKV
ncbi:MAG: DUF2478 domain-containing protein [Hyphomicrobiaceae bacterium]|nr:MAG: DUF2478 domain-containing protein [Hyphomicrobiaceae bacterium]